MKSRGTVANDRRKPAAGMAKHYSEDEIAALLQASADWTFELDANGVFTHISDSTFETSGVKPSMLLGRRFDTVLGRVALSAGNARALKSLFSERKPFRDFIGGFGPGKGKFHYFAASGFPLFGENGKFLGYRGVGRDISAIVMADERLGAIQARLDQSHELLSSVFSTLEAAIIVFDADDRLHMANGAALAIYEGVDKAVFEPGTALTDFLGAVYDAPGLSDITGSRPPRDVWIAGRLEEYHQPVFHKDVLMGNGRWVRFSNRRLENGLFIGLRTDISALKSREAQLEELVSAAALATGVVNGIDQAIFVKDEDLRFVSTNHSFDDIFGHDFEVMRGKRAIELIDSQLAEVFEESERWVLETGEPFEVIQDFIGEDGSKRWRTVRKNRIHASDGRTYLVGFISEVTALKRSSDEAEHLGQLLQDAVDAMDQSFTIYDPEDRLQVANKAFRAAGGGAAVKPGMTFAEIADTLSRHHFEGKPDDERRRWLQRQFHVRSDAIASQKPIEIQEPDGRWRLLDVRRTTTGSTLDMRLDVTESKDRELRLRESLAKNELYRSIIDNVPVPIYAKDKRCRLTYANKGWERMSRLASGDAMGKDNIQLFGKDGQAFQDVDRAVLKDGIAREIEEQRTLPDGNVQYQLSQKAAIDVDGERVLIGCTMDVTDARLREHELAEARAKAELADRAKSEFLANMSHEIRTPMNGVLGMAELLAKTELTDKQRTFADIIVKSGNALLTIINDILDFSKIDAGKLVLDPVPFSLSEVVQDVAALVSVRAKEKDLELIVRIQPDLPDQMTGDVGRIRQMITNLSGNAVKFTDRGHVLIDVSGRVRKETTVLRIAVTDTGIGISADKLPSVFEKFNQVDASSTRRHEGTGLGLAITSRLAEMMNGRIGAESTAGEGSTFWIEIELPHHEERAKIMKMPVDVSGARVLIVDDNPVNRTILLEQMAAWSFDACAAAEGPEGIALLHAAAGYNLPVDCVILDSQMPGMNGEDVARAITADPRLAGTPIILLTSVDHSLGVNDQIAMGIGACLVKPARSSALLEAIIHEIQTRRGEPTGAPVRYVPAATMEAGGAPMGETGNAAETSKIEPTDFSFELPKHHDGQKNRVDILVAEDNEVNQLVLTQILSDSPYSFLIVTNGELAVEAWADMAPRLVLMDVSMPNMNGLEATAHIRRAEQRDGLARTPIIGVTAHALKGDRDRCLESGMDDYLSKPISPDTLMRKVADWLENHGEKRSAG